VAATFRGKLSVAALLSTSATPAVTGTSATISHKPYRHLLHNSHMIHLLILRFNDPYV